MRCVDVIEALSSPTDLAPAPAALAEHLAQCPRCAAWARRDAQLTRLWEATRPEEPAPAVWSTIWANVTQALETTPATRPALASWSTRFASTAGARPWRRGAWATLVLAHAAVVLLVVWFLSGPRTGPELAMNAALQADSETRVARAGAKIEIDPGELVLLQSDGAGGVKVASRDDLTVDGSSAVDPAFDQLGKLEAMAE